MKEENILKYVENRKGNFLGCHAVPFPVYVIHVSYDSVDSDPFYPVYKAICKYIEIDPKKTKFVYFSHLIGLDKNLLEHSFHKLKEDGMIRFNKDSYVLTEDARRRYIVSHSRPVVRTYKTFIIDGKSLKILPEVIYQNYYQLDYMDENNSAHEPINPELNPAPYEKIVKLLNSKHNRDMLKLDSEASNFKIEESERRFLKGVMIVYYYSTDNKLNKDLVYEGQSIKSGAVSDYENYTIDMYNKAAQWDFKANLGFNSVFHDSTSTINQVGLKAESEGWAYILGKRYEVPNNEFFKISCDEVSMRLSIYLSSDNFKNSKKPVEMLEDCECGYIDFHFPYSGMVRVPVCHSLQDYVSFYNEVKLWKKSEKSGITFREHIEKMFPLWRKWMVYLGKFELLEKIDCDCFIKKI